MSIISMAIHNLPDTPRHDYTVQTLESLLETVDFNKHKLYLGDNASCDATKDYLKIFRNKFAMRYPEANLVIEHHATNIGTARAVNGGLRWALRERCNGIKMDNDVVVHQKGWVEQMEEVISRYPKCQVLGLKRIDLEEHPEHENTWFRSRLKMIPHIKGKQDYIIEICHHIMGTCTMIGLAALERLGGLSQPGEYAFDDSLYCIRAHVYGFETAFLPHIPISHIDAGGDNYTQWKRDYAGEMIQKFHELSDDYRSGRKPIYEPLS